MLCENKVLVFKPSPWLHSISKCLQAILKLIITLMCKSIGKTPLYYESSTEKHKSSSACCIKLHEVCCRWIVSVNFLVKIFHSAMKQGKIMNLLSTIGKSKTYFGPISPILKEDFGKCTVHGFL